MNRVTANVETRDAGSIPALDALCVQHNSPRWSNRKTLVFNLTLRRVEVVIMSKFPSPART
jgi:hypothetical protein